MAGTQMAAVTERGAPLDPVDFLMWEWRITEASHRVQLCVSRVLKELHGETLLSLRRESKLEVMIRPDGDHIVWAYFPMYPGLKVAKVRVPKPRTMAELLSAIKAANEDLYRRQVAAKKYKPKPATEVLLVINPTKLETQLARVSQDELRHHLGHTLLFLRHPAARNDCPDARKQWRACVREPAPRRGRNTK